jgi:hypothetical protein
VWEMLLRRLIGPKAEGDAKPQERQPDPATYRIIYDEAVRAITNQRDAVDELRARAGTLLAAVNIATAFLAGTSLATPVSPFAAGAFGCFAVAVLLCVAVLWPSQGWVFTFNAGLLVRDYAEASPPASAAETHRDLALWLQQHYEENEPRLRRRYWRFGIACAYLGVEIALWLASYFWRNP